MQSEIITLAKGRVFSSERPLSEIAYELGFKNQSHFSKFFKQKTGKTPLEYRLGA
ncbi:MAG: helix-turn-helix domain-containing protein [Chitinophagaceae bacterium]